MLTIASLGGDFPMLAGNVVAIGFSGLVCIVVSLIKPQNYDWALMKEIPMIEEDSHAIMEDVSGGQGARGARACSRARTGSKCMHA